MSVSSPTAADSVESPTGPPPNFTTTVDKLDLAILSTVVEKFGGGPVGLSTLSAAVGEETDTIEDVVEPYLLQLGFLQRTPRGRTATPRAYEHLGVTAPGQLSW